MITRIRLYLFVLILAVLVVAGGPAAPAPSLALSQPGSVPATPVPPGHSSAQALVGVSLSPSLVTVPVLETFTLDVLVNCGTNADATSVRVNFTPAYMEVVALTQDTAAFSDVLRTSFDNVNGVLYYDAGSLLCHSQGTCPAGVIRVASITFRARAATFPSRNVSVYGQVTWGGSLTFDGPGTGSTITITSPVSPVYLPLAVRGWPR